MRKIVILCFLTLFVFAQELIKPLPQNVEFNEKKALLGKKLFHDTRLSRDNTISCATCHNLHEGGDDNIAVSFGVDGKKGVLNSPTVYNSRYNLAQFWDGRARDLKEQAVGPIHNPLEMDTDLREVLMKLKKDENLKKEFQLVYASGLTKENIVDAIVEFEKALVTANAPFDKYLRGDKTAITQEQLEGFNLFKEYGCISCHNGVNIGSNLFQKVGVAKRFSTKVKYKGRYEITKDEMDINYFKVPTLRNITKTAPYFHDGSIHNLEDAVRVMFQVQLGYDPTEDEIKKIVAFLHSLEGEIPSIVGSDK